MVAKYKGYKKGTVLIEKYISPSIADHHFLFPKAMILLFSCGSYLRYPVSTYITLYGCIIIYLMRPIDKHLDYFNFLQLLKMHEYFFYIAEG